ncbi:MAG: NAD(P)(+) transhydrogenase (Re/Si-specific) subunit beta, partial [Bacilli bacterium]
MSNIILALNTSNLISPTLYYIICAVLALVILLGIYLMSKVKTSVFGNGLSAFALLLGIIVTFVRYNVLPMPLIYVALAIGTILGLILAYKVKMIEMPQMVALLNGLGGGASLLVGIFAAFGIGANLDAFSKSTSLLAISVGVITLLGSLIAAGKLHKIFTQKPIVFKGHQIYTTISLILAVGMIIIGSIPNLIDPTIAVVGTMLLSSIFGIMFTIRVGGADMPITISLLNSFSGVAGAIAGLAISDTLLVAVGGIVGSSGLLLTQIMCKAMNRSLMDILLGKTTVIGKKEDSKVEVKQKVTKEKESSHLELLKSAKNV